MGLGALSIILPQPILALIRLAIYWHKAKPRIRHGPRPSRWKYLLGDTAAMLVGSIAFMLTYQGGQIILGRLYPLSVAAGIYYFCTVLADQSVRVLVNNLGGVLLPALSRIQDDRERITKALVNATGLLLLVGVPMCAIQAVLAGPLIRVFFNDKWLPAIGCFAAMSVAAIGRLALCPAESMLIAQGRFRTYMTLAIVYAAVFLGSMGLAAYFSPEDEVATWVAASGGACLLVMGPIAFVLAMGREGVRSIGRLLGVPIAATAVSLIPAGVMVYTLPRTNMAGVMTIAVGTLCCGAIYLTLIRLLAPLSWDQLAVRTAAVAPARFRPLVSRLLPAHRAAS